MSIIGHGVDILDLSEVQCILDSPEMETSFLERTFTKSEINDFGTGVRRIEKIASRLAAKEAVMKALGEGFGEGVAFTDVEIQKLPNGAPKVILHRKLKALADKRRITKWYLSISHSKTSTIASVVAVNDSD